MPCLEISIPAVDDKTRSRLARSLTDAFTATTGFGADIFGVRFHEYEPGKAASAGVLWDGGDGRPYLHFLLYCPRLRREVKSQVVEALTAAYTECVGKPDWKPVIHIAEHPYDNVGVGGKILSEAYEECAGQNFYYEMRDK